MQLDTDAARRFATAMAARADDLHHARCNHASVIDRLELGMLGWHAVRPLETAIEATWELATFTTLLVDEVERDDHFDLGSRRALAPVVDLADGLAGRRGWLAGWHAVLGASGPLGEPGQLHDAELRSPYTILGSTPLALGRNLLLRALSDTTDDHQLRADEFGLVQMGSDHYVVVLPGATDLSSPDWNLSDENRTVRDLDRYAVRSSRTSDVADNRYAQMVRDGLARVGVPDGAHLAIVGHSFGADTALDLAADESFTDRYDLSHVVAAGYWSQPQLADVRPGVEVLVLQNSIDAAVIAESVGHSQLAQAAEARGSAVGHLLDGDLGGALGATIDAVGHELSAIVDAGEFVVEHADDLVEMGGALATHRFDRVAAGALDLIRLDAGVTRDGDIVVDVFDGADRGAGHHPANYAAHVEGVADAEVVAFLDSLGGAGYAGWGAAVAVDVSVPRD